MVLSVCYPSFSLKILKSANGHSRRALHLVGNGSSEPIVTKITYVANQRPG